MPSLEYIRCPRCKNDVPINYLFCPYCGYDLRFIIRERLKARLTFREILYRIVYLIRKPFPTMKHIASAPDSTGAFIAWIIASLALTLKISIIFSKYAPIANAWVFLFLLLTAMFLQFIVWFSIALFIQIGMRLVGGKGLFSDILNIVGYTHIYIAIGHLITAAFIAPTGAVTGIQSVAETFSAGVMLYIPILLFMGIMTGYGLSYTHLLKRYTAISLCTIVMIIYVVFFYMI